MEILGTLSLIGCMVVGYFAQANVNNSLVTVTQEKKGILPNGYPNWHYMVKIETSLGVTVVYDCPSIQVASDQLGGYGERPIWSRFDRTTTRWGY